MSYQTAGKVEMSCRRWRCGSRDCCSCWWYFRANRIIVVSSLDARSGDSKLMLHAAFCFCFSFFFFFLCCCCVYNNSWKCSNSLHIGNKFCKYVHVIQSFLILSLVKIIFDKIWNKCVLYYSLRFIRRPKSNLISKIIKNNLTFIYEDEFILI